jgi:hypothetical protein
VTLTSAEAAAVLDVTTNGLRDLVYRGRLTPIVPGARPLEFHAKGVYDLQVERRTAAQRAAHDALWEEYDRALLLVTHSSCDDASTTSLSAG